MANPNESDPSVSRLISPRKAAVQVIGFLIGVALLAWCIHSAVGSGDWSQLLNAPPRLFAGLLACTLASLVFNGAQFWVTAQPLKPLRFSELQWLNFAANLLNLAPIRLGVITRIVYHLRIDRLTLLEVGAWFASIAGVLGLGVGGCLAATMIRPELDGLWVLAATVATAVGAGLVRSLVTLPVFTRYSRGVERVIADPIALGGSCLFRLLDIGVFIARMWIAAEILGLALPGRHVVILALVALIAGLVPFGKLGVREWAVATIAVWLADAGLNPDQISAMAAADEYSPMYRLALLESAGEAAVVIPAGVLGVWMLRRRLREAFRAHRAEDPQESPADHADSAD